MLSRVVGQGLVNVRGVSARFLSNTTRVARLATASSPSSFADATTKSHSGEPQGPERSISADKKEVGKSKKRGEWKKDNRTIADFISPPSSRGSYQAATGLLETSPDALDASTEGLTFRVETYGCQANVNDSEYVSAILEKAGYTEVPNPKDAADVILINTCSIREKAEDTVWQRLREIKAHRKGSRKESGTKMVGVLGCMAERLKTKLLEADKMVDVVCGPDSYRDLPRLMAHGVRGEQAANTLLSLDETYADIMPVRRDKYGVSAFVSIARGCNNHCSFCVVPRTRGQERSRPVDSILAEVKELTAQGYKEITLLGQNVNSYNDLSALPREKRGRGAMTRPFIDGFSSFSRESLKEGGVEFAELLERVAEVDRNVRIRFTSPHPKDFPEHLMHVMAKNSNICNSVHMPAQSGHTRTLHRMRRGYTRESYLALIKRFRTIIPNLCISTDMIMGFCGELPHEHEATVSLMKEVGYDQAFMFAYSLREQTYATRTYKDDVDPEEKKRRLNEVIAAFYEKSLEKNQEREGRTELVLVERPSKRGAHDLRGRTDGNIVVNFTTRPVPTSLQSHRLKQAGQGVGVELRTPMPGDYVAVKITSCTAASVRAEPIALSSISEFSAPADTTGIPFRA